MARPSVTTVEFLTNAVQFDALSVSVGITTPSSSGASGGVALAGIPQIGVEVVVNAHDTENLCFDDLFQLFENAQATAKDQIGDIKITFWKDESHTDVICTCSFSGWIDNLHFHSGDGGNHTLVLHLLPAWNGSASLPALDVSN